MTIRYEIDVPLQTRTGQQLLASHFDKTFDELQVEFGFVECRSVYRPQPGVANPDKHEECVRFWFDARDVSDTHIWLARWLDSTAQSRFANCAVWVAWYHPT